MGQAKNRGTKEERAKESNMFEAKKVEELRRAYEISDDAEFCGFLIHIPIRDEFLHSIEDSDYVIKRAFSRTPEQAKRFDHEKDARKYTRLEKGEEVVGMFDIGTQLLVVGLPHS